jgi:amidohydrolase
MGTDHPWMASIRPAVAELQSELVRLRRDFHRHPEPGFEELRTSAKVAEYLADCGGYHLRTEVAQTGVVADIAGPNGPDPLVLLRADMDALRIQEENPDLEYRSQRKGVMHACGHDVHMAILLGVARVLARHHRSMKGGVRLLFQPAEEGPGGAEPMIDAGVLENPRPVAAFALHVWSLLPLGRVAVREGPIMAFTDELVVRVVGRAGHGACPHEAVDPILAAAHFVVAAQSIVSRNVDPLDSAVVTFGKVRGGSVMNAIADQVTLDGTQRAYLPETRALLTRRLREIARGVDEACGTRTEVTVLERYPALVNDAGMSRHAREVAEEVLGGGQVEMGMRLMGGEDMAFFLREIPGCFFFLGGGNPQKGCDRPHHHPGFAIDEDAMPVGVEILLRLVERFVGTL